MAQPDTYLNEVAELLEEYPINPNLFTKKRLLEISQKIKDKDIVTSWVIEAQVHLTDNDWVSYDRICDKMLKYSQKKTQLTKFERINISTVLIRGLRFKDTLEILSPVDADYSHHEQVYKINTLRYLGLYSTWFKYTNDVGHKGTSDEAIEDNNFRAGITGINMIDEIKESTLEQIGITEADVEEYMGVVIELLREKNIPIKEIYTDAPDFDGGIYFDRTIVIPEEYYVPELNLELSERIARTDLPFEKIVISVTA